MSKNLKIAYTAAGAPQAPTLVRQLRRNGEYDLTLIGLDMNAEVIGRFLSDGFRQIPAAGAAGYKEAILDFVRNEKPDAILNCSGADVAVIAKLKEEIEALGTTVICSSAEAIDIAENKYALYRTVSESDSGGVPEFHNPRSLEEFVATARGMGYPDRDLCFKPHVSKGTRGFRVLSERFDKRDLLLNHKPTSRYMTLDEFISIFEGDEDFPELLLMEMLDGEELDVMTLAYESEALLTTVKTRESHRWGVIDRGAHVERPEIVEAVKRVIKAIPLSYNLSLQYIDGKLIEINPRTSTFIFQDDLNEPWLAIKLALGLITPDEVKGYQSRIRMGRQLLRYMDQIMIDPDGTWSD
jgi:carbamoyl-phosphate synthase large subunit